MLREDKCLCQVLSDGATVAIVCTPGKPYLEYTIVT